MNARTNAPRIAIVGAGMGGLTLATALARRGIMATIYEQAPALREVGAGITITPNASRVLDHLGLEPALAAVAIEPLDQYIRHHATGAVQVHFDRRDIRQRYGAPYWQVHRADLHTVLSDGWAKAGGTIALGCQLVGLEAAGPSLKLVFADGRSAEADIVIGADGVKSVVRNLLFGEEPALFMHQVAWRGTVPAEALPERIGPESCVWIAPQRIFVRYPIRRGALVNYVSIARTETWEVESWTQRADAGVLLEALEGWHQPTRDAVAATPEGICHKWGLFVRAPLQRWHEGAVGLMGDAAHPILPFMGQGAALAIEDAMVLARALAESADAETAFTRFAATRQERVDFIRFESEAGAGRLQGDRPDLLTPKTLRNEDTLDVFSYDPVTVPV